MAENDAAQQDGSMKAPQTSPQTACTGVAKTCTQDQTAPSATKLVGCTVAAEATPSMTVTGAPEKQGPTSSAASLPQQDPAIGPIAPTAHVLLLQLPGELRTLIYTNIIGNLRHAVQDHMAARENDSNRVCLVTPSTRYNHGNAANAPFFYDGIKGRELSPIHCLHLQALALIHGNRQIHDELMPLYLDAFNLFVHVDEKLVGVQKFIDRVGERNAPFLGTVKFIVRGCYQSGGMPLLVQDLGMRISRLLAVHRFKPHCGPIVDMWTDPEVGLKGVMVCKYGRALTFTFG
ncbi:hypothetical protein LTS18_003814 [Coniosporium uncinatum]|uniref:Uncharacterized protein n=1 Tax=Coniosporium uncinatum TaxID=93489 RepID=A0ACC3DZ69_9PEZI|nr:hypothetical protein LTS18_003814 [Coniosporium uncinatum]